MLVTAAMSLVSALLFGARQTIREAADESRVGTGVHVNLFFRQRDGQVGRVGCQVAACRLDRRGDLLLGVLDNLASIFFVGGFDARFLGTDVGFARRLHRNQFI